MQPKPIEPVLPYRTENLRPHPLNQKIYGADKPSRTLVEDIRARGIIEPLVVEVRPDGAPTFERRILSGHMRWLAAKELGLETVPVITRIVTESESMEVLLAANLQRVKTWEQKGREFIEWKRIESELARQRSGTRTDLRANLPTGSEGRARDIAADKIGVGARTLEKLESIITAADSGSEKARDILDVINTGEMSVDAAYQKTARRRRCEAVVHEIQD